MDKRIEDFLQRISYLGHDGFLIRNSKNIYFDPFRLKKDLPPADIIFITHLHYDHLSIEDIKKIQKDSTKIVVPPDGLGKVRGNLEIIRGGEEKIIDGLNVKAVPAYNIGKAFHPKSNGWVGYIVELDGIKIYHAGDTDFIPEMKSIECDIALLPVSGTYVMDSKEAIEAAKAIKPSIAIPMHYGEIVGSRRDAEDFKKGLEGIVEVKIFEKI